MIPVTKPFLPPREEYEKYLAGIWQREWLTNMGPLSSDLEMRLKKHLQVKQWHNCIANGYQSFEFKR